MLLMFFKFLDAIGVKDPRVPKREAQVANAYWRLGFWTLGSRVDPKRWNAYREAVVWDPPETVGKAWETYGLPTWTDYSPPDTMPTIENVTNGVNTPSVKGWWY